MAACAFVAVVVYLVMVTWMFWGEGFSLHHFKAFGAQDQQSYLAIAVNFTHGDFRSVEPYTQTGAIHYPRLYYQALGATAWATHTDPVVWWWVGSLGSQAALVATVSAAAVGLTRRRWLAVLGPLALTAGVFSVFTGADWAVGLKQHALLWGPFAEFFAGNGATIALTIDAVCLILLTLVVSGRISGRRAVVVTAVAAVALGAMANVHTYTFLMGVYVVTYVLAFYGMLRRPGRPALLAAVASAVLLVLLFVLGPRVVDGTGPLVLLMAGLLPAAPGVLLVALRDRRVFGVYALVALAAAPQVLFTTAAVRAGDPFLVYRQASTSLVDLGVPLGTGLLHGALLVLILGAILWAGVASRHAWWMAIGLGAGLAWVLLWTNDVWGASQEPYRLWLNGYAMLLPVVAVVGAWVLADQTRRWTRPVTAALVGLAVVSLLDYAAFSVSSEVSGTVSYHTPRMDALARVTARVPLDRGKSLVLAGPCVDARKLKVRTGVAVAWDNIGMAWATKHDEILKLIPVKYRLDPMPPSTKLDVATARRAGVRYVLTDSSCHSRRYEDPSLRLVGSEGYRLTDGTKASVRLWSLG